MSDKRLLGCLIFPVLLLMCGLLTVPVLLYREVPKLTQYNDTRLLDQKTQFVFLNNICISTFYFTQEYQAAITGEEVWDRLSEQWDVRPDTYFKTGNEAFSERDLVGNLDLTSNVLSYNIDQSNSIIVVSNQFVYKFPKRMCNPFTAVAPHLAICVVCAYRVALPERGFPEQLLCHEQASDRLLCEYRAQVGA